MPNPYFTKQQEASLRNKVERKLGVAEQQAESLAQNNRAERIASMGEFGSYDIYGGDYDKKQMSEDIEKLLLYGKAVKSDVWRGLNEGLPYLMVNDATGSVSMRPGWLLNGAAEGFRSLLALPGEVVADITGKDNAFMYKEDREIHRKNSRDYTAFSSALGEGVSQFAGGGGVAALKVGRGAYGALRAAGAGHGAALVGGSGAGAFAGEFLAFSGDEGNLFNMLVDVGALSESEMTQWLTGDGSDTNLEVRVRNAIIGMFIDMGIGAAGYGGYRGVKKIMTDARSRQNIKDNAVAEATDAAPTDASELYETATKEDAPPADALRGGDDEASVPPKDNSEQESIAAGEEAYGQLKWNRMRDRLKKIFGVDTEADDALRLFRQASGYSENLHYETWRNKDDGRDYYLAISGDANLGKFAKPVADNDLGAVYLPADIARKYIQGEQMGFGYGKMETEAFVKAALNHPTSIIEVKDGYVYSLNMTGIGDTFHVHLRKIKDKEHVIEDMNFAQDELGEGAKVIYDKRKMNLKSPDNVAGRMEMIRYFRGRSWYLRALQNELLAKRKQFEKLHNSATLPLETDVHLNKLKLTEQAIQAFTQRLARQNKFGFALSELEMSEAWRVGEAAIDNERVLMREIVLPRSQAIEEAARRARKGELSFEESEKAEAAVKAEAAFAEALLPDELRALNKSIADAEFKYQSKVAEQKSGVVNNDMGGRKERRAQRTEEMAVNKNRKAAGIVWKDLPKGHPDRDARNFYLMSRDLLTLKDIGRRYGAQGVLTNPALRIVWGEFKRSSKNAGELRQIFGNSTKAPGFWKPEDAPGGPGNFDRIAEDYVTESEKKSGGKDDIDWAMEDVGRAYDNETDAHGAGVDKDSSSMLMDVLDNFNRHKGEHYVGASPSRKGFNEFSDNLIETIDRFGAPAPKQYKTFEEWQKAYDFWSENWTSTDDVGVSPTTESGYVPPSLKSVSERDLDSIMKSQTIENYSEVAGVVDSVRADAFRGMHADEFESLMKSRESEFVSEANNSIDIIADELGIPAAKLEGLIKGNNVDEFMEEVRKGANRTTLAERIAGPNGDEAVRNIVNHLAKAINHNWKRQSNKEMADKVKHAMGNNAEPLLDALDRQENMQGHVIAAMSLMRYFNDRAATLSAKYTGNGNEKVVMTALEREQIASLLAQSYAVQRALMRFGSVAGANLQSFRGGKAVEPWKSSLLSLISGTDRAEDVIKDFGEKDMDKLARVLAASSNDTDESVKRVNDMVRMVKDNGVGWTKTLNEYIIVSLLGSPRTLGVNLVSNVGKIAFQYPHTLFAGAYGDFMRSVNPNFKGGASMSDAALSLKASVDNFQVILAMANMAYKRGQGLGVVGSSRGSMENPNAHNLGSPIKDDAFNRHTAFAQRGIHHYTNALSYVSTRPLTWLDEFLKGWVFFGGLSVDIQRLARQSHRFSPESDKRSVDDWYEFYRQSENTPWELVDKNRLLADTMTSTKYSGENWEAIARVSNKHTAIKIFVPFMRSIVNETKFAMKRGAWHFDPDWYREFVAGGDRQADAMGTLAVSASLWSLAYTSYKMGFVRPPYDGETWQKRAEQALGQGEFSGIMIGDGHVLDAWRGGAIPMIISGYVSIIDMLHKVNMDDKEREFFISDLVIFTTKFLKSGTGLAGIEELSGIFNETKPRSMTYRISKLLGAKLGLPQTLGWARVVGHGGEAHHWHDGQAGYDSEGRYSGARDFWVNYLNYQKHSKLVLPNSYVKYDAFGVPFKRAGGFLWALGAEKPRDISDDEKIVLDHQNKLPKGTLRPFSKTFSLDTGVKTFANHTNYKLSAEELSFGESLRNPPPGKEFFELEDGRKVNIAGALAHIITREREALIAAGKDPDSEASLFHIEKIKNKTISKYDNLIRSALLMKYPRIRQRTGKGLDRISKKTQKIIVDSGILE